MSGSDWSSVTVSTDQTVDLSEVIRQVRELEQARAAAEKRATVARVKRQPLAWSAALVLVSMSVCAVLAWVAYLAYA